jgi:hypothetical protein
MEHLPERLQHASDDLVKGIAHLTAPFMAGLTVVL